MKQYKELGGGSLSHDGKVYITWTVVKCPNCQRVVKEYYMAEELGEDQLNEIIKDQNKKTPVKNLD